tara:strand:+ start:1797 stop:2027 length:231 start_codon:yes stop_codon:yes gene_type:complete
MSQSKIAISVSELVSFIKDKTVSNLVESRSAGNINVDEDSLRKISQIIELSTQQALSLGYTGVEHAINEFVKNQEK